MAKSTDLLVAALAHAAAGRPVFPCRNAPGTDRHKTPLTENGFKNATTDLDQIRRWWRRNPDALIGMPTGVISGIDVVDLDRKNGKDGLAAVPDWRTLSAVVATTGSGGAHLYFSASGIRCTTEMIAPGVDTRGDGGYVIIPPSPGYGWISNDWASLASIPTRLRPSVRASSPADKPPHLPDSLLLLLEQSAGQGLSFDPDDLPPPLDPERARAALAAIPADCDYRTWFEIGCALRTELGEAGWPLFDAWSSRASTKYGGQNRARDQWDRCGISSFTAGTLIYHAKQHDPGWEACGQPSASTEKPQVKAEGKKSSLDDFIKCARDLRSMEFEPQQWLVPRYIPEGLTLIVGKPKIGKSWLAMDIATAVATGGDCLGERCEQGDVLALFLEDTDRRLQRRLQMMLSLSDWPTQLAYATQWPRLDVGGIEKIGAWIEQTATPRLILIDVLQRVRMPPRGREPYYQADYNALSALHDLAGDKGISVVVLHHQRKLAADDPFDTVSGTLGLTGSADHLMVLERSQLGKCLAGRGRDAEEFNLAVEQDRWFRWRVLGAAEEVLISEKRAAIIAVLRKSGGDMTVTEISHALGESSKNTKATLAKMHFKGEVDRVKVGTYRLPKRQVEMDLDDDLI